MRYNTAMQLDARDQLAATMAASLASDDASPAEVASRAYDLAEALLEERQRRQVGGFAALIEALPHDPHWEVEPRWSHLDRLALAAAEGSAVAGPGLASVRPERRGAVATGS